MDDARRVAAGFAEAERRRALGAAGGEIVELDGLLMAFTNLADASLNAGLAVDPPGDPVGALAAAEAAASARGQPLGLEVERGRFPDLEAALLAAGMTRLFSRPAMTARPASIARPASPPGLGLTRVVDAAGLDAMVRVEIDAFGTDPDVARGLLSTGMLNDPQTRAFVGTLGGEPVGQSIATHHAGAVGIFGVGVRAAARRRGVGALMTAAAAAAFPDGDLAWLHPTSAARRMYERLGFREVATWDVWTRPAPRTDE
jgi:ribosomal protein S18 acetylase RimI-like enzyme